MTLEKDIQNQIIVFLRSKRIFCWKNDSVGIYDPKLKVFRSNRGSYKIKGVSDILGIVNGRFLAVEVKTQKGKLTPEQIDFLDEINSRGGIAFVARSVEDVIGALKVHGIY